MLPSSQSPADRNQATNMHYVEFDLARGRIALQLLTFEYPCLFMKQYLLNLLGIGCHENQEIARLSHRSWGLANEPSVVSKTLRTRWKDITSYDAIQWLS